VKSKSLCLAVVTMFALGTSFARAADCALTRVAALNLSERADGALLVPVTLDRTNIFLVLATSAPHSSLRKEFADSHQLQTREIDNWTTIAADGRKAPMRAAIIDDLSLGQVHFKRSHMHVNPFTPAKEEHEHDGIPIGGNMGWEMLSGFDVELDVSHHVMNLYSQNSCLDRVVFWADRYDKTPIFKGGTGEIYFPMELDGQRLETALGTLYPTTLLRTDISKKLYNFDEHSSGVYQSAESDGVDKPYYRAMAINSHGLSVVNARIALVVKQKNGSECEIAAKDGVVGYTTCLSVHPLTLGRNVLSKLHIYIATKQEVMYFTAADASATDTAT
jgi:hypothetical protein